MFLYRRDQSHFVANCSDQILNKLAGGVMSTQNSSFAGFKVQSIEKTSTRNSGLDALRACITLLVVFHHCAITYGAIGGWYYHEIPPDKSFTSVVLVLFCSVNQAFFMGLFFLLAGHYTAWSIDKKGSTRFLADRLLRLGAPLLVYGLLLGPITIALAATRAGQPFFGTLIYLWRKGTFENGPMWFAQALLLFSAATVAGRWILSGYNNSRRLQNLRNLVPSNSMLCIAALLTGAAALALRSVWPVGVNVWGLQLGYFASYIVLYAAGYGTARARWIEHLPERQVRLWWRIALIALPVLPIVYFAGKPFPALRGFPLAVVYAFWEPLVAWGIILILVDGFQRHFHRLDGLWSSLSRRAYTIYIIHPPVLVGVALMWKNIPASPFLKFAVTGSVACFVCYLIAGLLLWVPAFRKVL
jgi:Acyltransferase family